MNNFKKLQLKTKNDRERGQKESPACKLEISAYLV